MNRDFVVLGGSANPDLATAVAAELGGTLARSVVERFPDGEVSVRIDESVRRREVFIVQPTAPPVDQNLLELLCFADAARRAAADRITAVIPYFGYGRSDKRHGRREPIAARMVGDVLQAAGVDHVITIDLHAPQIEGFFRVPVDVLSAVPVLSEALLSEGAHENTVIASPDAGRVKMAADYARRLGLPVVVLNKHRESGTETSVTHIVGEVADRRCIIIDDMIATGGTLAGAIEALLNAGARNDIIVAATHGLLLPGARDTLDHTAVTRVIVTDSVATPHTDWGKLHIVSVAPLIAAAIHEFVRDGSLRPLF